MGQVGELEPRLRMYHNPLLLLSMAGRRPPATSLGLTDESRALVDTTQAGTLSPFSKVKEILLALPIYLSPKTHNTHTLVMRSPPGRPIRQHTTHTRSSFPLPLRPTFVDHGQ